jgi:hypothetical protein
MVYIPCDCHTPYHFLVFEPDADQPQSIYVSFVSTRNGSFWHRLKWAVKHVFKREDLTFADIIIDYADLKRRVDGLVPPERKGDGT